MCIIHHATLRSVCRCAYKCNNNHNPDNHNPDNTGRSSFCMKEAVSDARGLVSLFCPRIPLTVETVRAISCVFSLVVKFSIVCKCVLNSNGKERKSIEQRLHTQLICLRCHIPAWRLSVCSISHGTMHGAAVHTWQFRKAMRRWN